ncbi:MAG: site-specific DNA-methyltransferase [Flavobacteriaceae bacterium]|nr:MAG: site-specific DNA-methyltransferase [Flavobacteriaceae bacterium]
MKANTIYQMDCLDGIKQIQSNSVTLIIADPPYFLGMTHNGSKGSFVDLAICKPFFLELFKEFKRILRPDGVVFYFTDWRGYAFYYPLFDSVLSAKNLIIWDKLSGPGSFYSYCHELILFHTSNTKLHLGGSNIWRNHSFGNEAKYTNGTKVHPTQKPKELIQKMIEQHSQIGDLICDPFCGSGTTALVARTMKRDFIGFELDLANFKIMRERLQRDLTQIETIDAT